MERTEIKNNSRAMEEPLLLKQDFNALTRENRKLKKALAKKKSELDELQNQFARLENLAAIGANGATVAHELNNPLTAICAEADEVLDLLQEKIIPRSLIEQSAHNIKNSSHRMRSIINQFQTHCSETARKPWTKQNLTEIIGKSVDLIRPQLKLRDIKVLMDLQKDLPEIWGERCKLESILQNLLLNAMDAFLNDDDGKLRQIVITANHKNRFVEITIKDNGAGIPAHLRKKIFTPFFTTKKQDGMGLGLAIVAGYVRKHHGQICLNSVVNTGTEFILKFPLERRNGRSQKSSSS